MLARIYETARNDCRLSPGQTILVGVSGGPDSLCLLDALHRLDFQVIAAYFNHQLRPEADQEALFVEREAGRMGIRFIVGQGQVSEAARRNGQSIETAARELRYRFLFDSARSLGAEAVAVAHNANDQAETVLMHILRGSGLDGLTGMAFRSLTGWDEHIPLVRPLLNCWREEIEAYCAETGLQPVMDGSNREPLYLRNRIRLTLLPEMERLAPGAGQRLWNLAQLAAADLQFMAQLEQQAWADCVVDGGAGRIGFDLNRMRALAEALQRRLIRRAAATLRTEGEGLSRENAMRAVEFIHTPGRARQIELAQKLVLRIEGDRLYLMGREYRPDLSRYPQMEGEAPLTLAIPGELDLGNGWRITCEQTDLPLAGEFPSRQDELQFDAWLDADDPPGSLAVRRPVAGDRVQPLGMSKGSQKLSDFWINHHIPARARRTWPLVLCGERIAWIPGFPPAHAFRIRPESKRCIHLRIQSV